MRQIMRQRRRGQSPSPADAYRYVETLRPTIAALDEGVCALDSVGHILCANHALCETLGWAERALVGRRLLEFAHPQQAPHQAAAADDALTHALARGAGAEEAWWEWRRGDGKQVALRCALQPITQGGGRLGVTLLVVRPAPASASVASATPASPESARANTWLNLLAGASATLNATLDYTETCERLADLLTPQLACACAIYLLEDGGALRRAVTRVAGEGGATPALRRWMETLPACITEAAEAGAEAPGEADERVSLIWRTIQTRAFTRAFTAPAPARVGGEPGGVVCAPLLVRGHALGVVYLVGGPEQTFPTGDLALIQGLAERAAIAIDNARLYSETEQALTRVSEIATQLDTIFDATDVGIYVIDAEGRSQRVNRYGVELLGLPDGFDLRSPTLPRDAFELRTPEGEPIPLEREPLYLARTQGRPVEQRVVIHRRHAGKRRDAHALARCAPLRDATGRVVGAVGVLTDITTLYQLERQKDEFLGIASHELKTPLTTLKILAHMIARKMEASGDEREREQARQMSIAISRMARLINDLLDVSRIQDGTLTLSLTETDLAAICREAVREQEMIAGRSIRLSLPAGLSTGGRLPIVADPDRVGQALTNLLSNAIKYSPLGAPILVRVRQTGEAYTVAVEDRGPGAPPEAAARMFERFFRVPGMQVQTGSGVGLGLGLHITKEIIARHRGRVWVESKLGHGSVFAFSLPRSGPTPTAGSALPAEMGDVAEMGEMADVLGDGAGERVSDDMPDDMPDDVTEGVSEAWWSDTSAPRPAPKV